MATPLPGNDDQAYKEHIKQVFLASGWREHADLKDAFRRPKDAIAVLNLIMKTWTITRHLKEGDKLPPSVEQHLLQPFDTKQHGLLVKMIVLFHQKYQEQQQLAEAKPATTNASIATAKPPPPFSKRPQQTSSEEPPPSVSPPPSSLAAQSQSSASNDTSKMNVSGDSSSLDKIVVSMMQQEQEEADRSEKEKFKVLLMEDRFDRRVARFMAPNYVKELPAKVKKGLTKFNLEAEQEGMSVEFKAIHRYLRSMIDRLSKDWTSNKYLMSLDQEECEIINEARRQYHRIESAGGKEKFIWTPSLEFIYETMEFPDELSVEHMMKL